MRLIKIINKPFLCLLLGILSSQVTNAQKSCVDTLMYTQAKATKFLPLTMNVPSEFSGYSQYYDAPQEVIVKGFKVYMGVNSSSSSDTAIVTGYLMDANVDSSVGTVLRQKTITVRNTYSPSLIHLMEYFVIFDTPDTVSSAFHVAVKTETTQPLGIITNDHNAKDGNGEELGYWHWTGDSSWHKSGQYFAWDVDFLLIPIVEYTPDNSISDLSIGCLAENTCFSYNPSSILTHKMYNETVFNGGSIFDSTKFYWGDGQSTVFPDTCHSYTMDGELTFISQQLTGWNTKCIVQDSFSVSPHNTYQFIDSVTECGMYSWNGNTYTSSIVDTATLNSIHGCDSIRILDLTIKTVDTSVSLVGTSFTSGALGASYQWLDCDNAFAQLSADTNRTFVASSIGNYAVEVKENGCTDTSACYNLASLGILENDFDPDLLIYPNPTKGDITIDLGRIHESVKCILTDIIGNEIQSNTYTSSQMLNLTIESPAGIYFLMIQSGTRQAVIKLVKE